MLIGPVEFDSTKKTLVLIVNSEKAVVRSGAGVGYSKMGIVTLNDKLIATDYYNGWWNTDKGWIQSAYVDRALENKKSVSTTKQNSSAPKKNKEDYKYASDEDEGSGYRPDINDVLEYSGEIVSESVFTKMNGVCGIFGLPYQFSAVTDPRIDGIMKSDSASIGTEYAERIVANIPLLLISPGRASFMTNYSKKQKQNLLEKFIAYGAGIVSAVTTEDLDLDSGRYYTFEYRTNEYYQYVNPMCRMAAIYLGLQDVKIDNTTLSSLDWRKYSVNHMRSIQDFGEYNCIPFYLESETSISESFSNGTTQSMIASTVNSISDMGRELNFLLGYGSNAIGLDNVINNAEIQSNIENVQETISGLLGKGNFMSNLANHLTTVAAGGKLMFPEIWSDSQFSRSYSCEIKLVAPDPSPLSIYLNVLVPFFHLLGLVAPQTIQSNPNAYANPFIVRAIYKGFFNVDMGIITDMSITKGAESQWTPDGLPVSMTVSISIKDLYNCMSITPTNLKNFEYDTVNNTALMDYIANLCGLNIFKPEITRMIEMMWMNKASNRIKDIPSSIWGAITNRVQNIIVNKIF